MTEKKRYYAGIGSRETPADVMKVMRFVSEKLDDRGFTLRSGGADGADTAFGEGATRKEIFLPWPGFNHVSGGIVMPFNRKAYAIAEAAHPNWAACSATARKLHTRNVHQVLGADLETPSEFVLCWTKGGRGGGGTGQAIRIAKANGIPVYDFATPAAADFLKNYSIGWHQEVA